MARFVLISIPDNEEADNFVRALGGNEVFVAHLVPGEGETPEVAYRPMPDAKVESVWAKPTMMCECHGTMNLGPRLKEKGLSPCTPVRSKKFGWLVCPQCAKPHAHQVQHPKDLLRPDATAQERVYYLGFRADQRPVSEH